MGNLMHCCSSHARRILGDFPDGSCASTAFSRKIVVTRMMIGQRRYLALTVSEKIIWFAGKV